MRLLRWIMPLVATLALIALPALDFSAPLVASSSWSVAQLATGSANRDFQKVVRQGKALRDEFGGSAKPDSGLNRALLLVALTPAMALVAGLAALLSWLWMAWGKARVYTINALIGLAATAYVVGASWWLTHAAREAVAQALAKAQGQFGGLLGHVDWKSFQSGLAATLGLTPGPGLYVLFLVFLAMLAWPGTIARNTNLS